MPLLGPGTELSDGFVVPDGAELMTWPTGDGFCSDAEPVWRASMLVTGDPIELFNDLAAQATELGFDVVEQDLGDCRILDHVPPHPWISCFTDGYRVSDGLRSERVSMSVSVHGESLPVAMVGVETVATERVGEFGDGPWQLRRFQPGPPGPTLPTSTWSRPTSASAIAWWRSTGTAPRWSRSHGSLLQRRPAVVQAGMTAAVHVDGDPDEVFDAYTDQLTSLGSARPASRRKRCRARCPRPQDSALMGGAGDSSFRPERRWSSAARVSPLAS